MDQRSPDLAGPAIHRPDRTQQRRQAGASDQAKRSRKPRHAFKQAFENSLGVEKGVAALTPGEITDIATLSALNMVCCRLLKAS
jgi:hypothetical protein